uniref:Carbamate kinase n=1 Tax=Rhodosorus marinus TaxID=101924 RepID=A0A7S0FZW7_9RHOD|mmetsp:Transcript_15207/g.22359  ORF Transcript_15207/g.22359 Transcript_15207/m.22359 type:complete len:345 (+) Transcript_15207:118-1152(+)
MVAFTTFGGVGGTRRSRARVCSESSEKFLGRTSVYPDKDLVVIALGGNALLRRGENLSDENQRHNARTAAEAIAKVINAGYRVCVTHGNGPQVGFLALMMPETRLDVLDAQTEGAIGYVVDLELSNTLGSRKQVVTMLTQVIVNENDPAFENPTKFIGPQYSEDQVEGLKGNGYTLKKDGDHWRRVVPSPRPVHIIEAEAVRVLLENNVTVVCTGGGGIPVVVKDDQRHGVDAVVDKDIASRVLAGQIGAKYLLLLTDADGVYRPDEFEKEGSKPIGKVSADDLKDQLHKFPDGSMRPKVLAATQFAHMILGGVCGIGCLSDALEILQGTRGTIVEATDAQGFI